MRVITVWALLLTVVILISALLLAPTYVLVEAQRVALSSEGDTTHETNAELEKDVRDTNARARALVLPAEEITSYADVIERISKNTTELVVLRGYRVLTADTGGQIQIQGIATSRTTLQTFETRLEAMPEVAAVDIPLSDLVRGTEVPFVATLTLQESL